MFVEHIELTQFRSYEHLTLDIPPDGLRIIGRNASGKTSALEALIVLSTTRSPRAETDRDLVGWQSGLALGVNAYTRLEARIATVRHRTTVAIGIELDEHRTRVLRKTYWIDGEPVRAHDLVGVLTCVLFSPEDVALVSGPPADRRREIDILISQMDRTYLRSLTEFGKVLTQRNQLLKDFARDRRSPQDRGAVTEISFWDEQFIALSSSIVAQRQIVAAGLGRHIRANSRTLADATEIDFTYRPSVALPPYEPGIGIDALESTIAARFDAQLRSSRQLEFRRGQSSVGPQRDDYQFGIAGRDLGAFGSRGQQRLGVVAFKLASIETIAERTGERPVLLLDDVLSELDETHRRLLLTELTNRSCQILITATDAGLLTGAPLSALSMVGISDGTMHPVHDLEHR